MVRHPSMGWNLLMTEADLLDGAQTPTVRKKKNIDFQKKQMN
jgi:hypothetical protein